MVDIIPQSRPFRTSESIDAEKATRDAVGPYLEALGFAVVDTRKHHGTAQSQTIAASKDALARQSDTFDDLPIEPNALGRDSGDRYTTIKSGFRRDAKVRQEVLRRSNGVCEKQDCHATRAFKGFLDVHHILGIYSSDRVWSCVALCPNCHRDAHFADDRDAINAAFQRYAAQFRSA